MTLSARRVMLAPAACIAFLALTPQHALADAPTVNGVAPAVWVLNGKPIRMVITGTGLSAVITVNFAPPIVQRSFVPYSDSALLVTLPPDVAPGEYAVTVTTPNEGSDPRVAPAFFVQTPAVVSAPPPLPPVQPAAAPPASPTQVANRSRENQHVRGRDEGPAPTVTPIAPVVPEPVRAPSPPVSPIIVGTLGAFLGCLAYLLWTSAGPVGAALRRGVLVRAVLRPARWARVAHVCPHCSRVRWPSPARDKPRRMGDYCSETCLRADVAAARVMQEGQEAALWRLHKVVGDLRGLLSTALESEVTSAGPDRALRIAEAQEAIRWPVWSGSEPAASEMSHDFVVAEGQPLSPDPPELAPVTGEFTLPGAARRDRPRAEPRPKARRGGAASAIRPSTTPSGGTSSTPA